MPRIQLTTPDGASHDFELTAERLRIGRAEDNDIVIPDGSVSSYHGEITLTDSGIHFHDNGSTNGTHVGGARVEDADIPWGGSFTLGNCPSILIGDAGGEAPAESYEEAPAAPEPEEAPAPAPAAFGGGSIITGLGSTPCPSSMRSGFGPKARPKDSAGSMLMLLGVIALLACAAAAFLITSLSA